MRRAMFALAGAMLLLYAPAMGQQPDGSRATVDAERANELFEGGRYVEGEQVVVWFVQEFPRADAETLTRQLDPAILALRRLIGAHEWQRDRGQKLRYYLRADDFIAHFDGRGGLHMAVARIRNGIAPFLHEAAHELLTPRGALWAVEFSSLTSFLDLSSSRPAWLEEGAATYLAQTVAGKTGFKEQDPFFRLPGLDDIDSDCATRVNAAEGRAMVGYMGVSRAPSELVSPERGKYAPVFYSCACSFTKYVVERTSLERVVNLFPLIPDRKVDSELERITGRSTSELRSEWLRSIAATVR